LLRIFEDYIRLGRKEHLRFDFFLPIILGFIISISLKIVNTDISNLLQKFSSHLGVIITAFSILAGFNTTSLTIFATSSSPVITKLKSEKIENTNIRKIEQLFAYFSWSIVVQLTLLLISIISTFVFSYLYPLEYIAKLRYGNFLLWITFFLAISAVLYSITLTIRNITILYFFLIADTRNDHS